MDEQEILLIEPTAKFEVTGAPSPQMALVEQWLTSVKAIPAVDLVWLEGSLAADRVNPASDIDLRLSIVDEAYNQLWETDRTPLLAGLGEYLLLENTFVRALTREGVIVEMWAHRTSQVQGLELFEWQVLFNRLPARELPFVPAPQRTLAETWPAREALTPSLVRRRMNFALVMMAESPACFYTQEVASILYSLDLARGDLLQLLYQRIGVAYGKRAKHFSQLFPAAWLAEFQQTYPPNLALNTLAQALVTVFRLQGQHLQALSEQAHGGFEPLWYWRLHAQMSEKLKVFF